MLINDIPAVAAHNAPAGATIHFEDRNIGFGAFRDRCQQLSQALAKLAPWSSRVAVMSTNCIEFMECYFGIPGAGMTMVPVNIRLAERDLLHVFTDSEPAVIIVEPVYLATVLKLREQIPGKPIVVVLGPASDGAQSYEALVSAEKAEPLARRPDDNDPAWLLYTSGTTGRSKGALLSHRNLMAGTTNMLAGFEFYERDVVMFMFPQFHVAGYVLLGYLLRGFTIVLMRGFEVGAYLANVQKYRITQHGLAPTMLAMVLEDPRIDQFDTSSLRQIGYGASAMPPEIIRAAMGRWPAVGFGTGFGMTELAGNVIVMTRSEHVYALENDHSVLSACGKPMPLSMVRIVDDEGRDVPTGQAGEMAVKGDQVFSGYWRNEKATAESFRDGWFLTGDVARRDAEGRFYIVDRKKDMIISGGENVYSREVEDVLYEHPSVAEAAVVGAADPKWGEKVVAIIRVRAGATPDAASIDAHCKTRIGGYKRPRRYIFVNELPKTPAGKIQKAQLRTQLREGLFGPDDSA